MRRMGCRFYGKCGAPHLAAVVQSRVCKGAKCPACDALHGSAGHIASGAAHVSACKCQSLKQYDFIAPAILAMRWLVAAWDICRAAAMSFCGISRT